MPDILRSREEETRSEERIFPIFSSGVRKIENDSSPTHKGRPYICKVCRIELSSKQSLASHLNKHKAERAPSVTAQFGGRAATSSFSRAVEESGVIGGSTTGDNIAGNSHHQTISFQLQSKDLPSRRLLGKGLAGYGYETTWKGERFVRKDFIGVPRRIFEKEATVLTGLENHKNIVKTYGWTADKRSCSLVLEYMENDLLSLLEKRKEIEQDLADIGAGCLSSAPTIKGPFDLPQAVDIMLQIAAGMKALHEQRIAHGDLKTKNILVTSVYNVGQNLMTVKVTDFGLVRSKKESKFIVSRQVKKLDMIQWKAPEYFIVRFKELNNLSYDRDGIIFSESGSSSESETESEASATPLVVNMRLPGVDVFAADVYSYGLICFHVLTGNDPYPNLNWKELGFKVLSGLRPNLPAECHPLLRDLLESCWNDDPTQRPTFSTIHLRLEDFHASVFLTSACAARRIQKAFRSHNEKKRQLAANRIQQKFRSWKVRKDFLNLRQQVVRIQACMRGERVRRGLRKLRWAASVLEKDRQRKVLGLQGFKNGDIQGDHYNISALHRDSKPATIRENDFTCRMQALMCREVALGKLDQYGTPSSSLVMSSPGLVPKGSVSPDGIQVEAQHDQNSRAPSRYEAMKRRDWNTFGQYLRNHRPPLALASCTGVHVLEFVRYLDQFGKTKVHTLSCPFFGLPHPPHPCPCPLRQAWGSLDAMIGRLRAAFEENGGKPESNPFGARQVRLYLREVREMQAKARGIAYEKKKKKKPMPPASEGGASGVNGVNGPSISDGVGGMSNGNVEVLESMEVAARAANKQDSARYI